MIAIDIGNTNVVIGFFNDKNLLHTERFKTVDFCYNNKPIKKQKRTDSKNEDRYRR